MPGRYVALVVAKSVPLFEQFTGGYPPHGDDVRRHPLSLRQGKDLLHELGSDISHETVRFWWNRFDPMLASEISIEQVFAKLKHFLREAAMRTLEAVCSAIAQLLGGFTPQRCTNFFKNSGYELTSIHHALGLVSIGLGFRLSTSRTIVALRVDAGSFQS